MLLNTTPTHAKKTSFKKILYGSLKYYDSIIPRGQVIVAQTSQRKRQKAKNTKIILWKFYQTFNNKTTFNLGLC